MYTDIVWRCVYTSCLQQAVFFVAFTRLLWRILLVLKYCITMFFIFGSIYHDKDVHRYRELFFPTVRFVCKSTRKDVMDDNVFPHCHWLKIKKQMLVRCHHNNVGNPKIFFCNCCVCQPLLFGHFITGLTWNPCFRWEIRRWFSFRGTERVMTTLFCFRQLAIKEILEVQSN